MLQYWFYPNPGNVSYDSPKVLLLLAVCAAMVIGSFFLRMWLRKNATPMLKKLGKTWPGAMFWFGIVGIVLTVARVEQIQFVAMRFLWILWALGLVAFAVIQWKLFKSRYYEVVPHAKVNDPREKYLPKARKH